MTLNLLKTGGLALLLSALFPFVGLQANTKYQEKQMHEAICGFSLKKVKRLVNQGYNVNQARGVYPMSLACYCYGGSSRIVHYFLDIGANPKRHKRGDYSPAMWCMRSMKANKPKDEFRRAVMRMIRKGIHVNHQTRTTGRTPISTAGKGDTEIVRDLLRRGADRNLKAKPGWDPGPASHQARRGGFVELALELEGKAPSSYHSTLHYAVKSGNQSKVREMLSSGTNVNETERISKYTPLHYAGMYDRPEIAKMLLKAGAKPSPVSYAGITPLRDAIVYYRRKLARALIDGGARGDNTQSQGCGSGMTEFDWAVSYGLHDIAKYMVEKDTVDVKKFDTLRKLWGYYNRELKLADFLLKKGARPSQSRIGRLKGMKQTKTRRKLIGLYVSALVKPPTNDFPPLPPNLSVRIRAMVLTRSAKRAETKFNKKFQSKKRRMTMGTERMP